jgi:hypothetical protein
MTTDAFPWFLLRRTFYLLLSSCHSCQTNKPAIENANSSITAVNITYSIPLLGVEKKSQAVFGDFEPNRNRFTCSSLRYILRCSYR